MPRSTPSTMRTVLVLLAVASFLGWMPRMRRTGSVRRHVELLRGITPIQQFAPSYVASRLFTEPGFPLDVTIVAHRIRAGAPYEFVPVDERELAAWLA